MDTHDVRGDFVKVKNEREEVSAVGRLLRHAAQTVESLKRIPDRVSFVKGSGTIGYQMYFPKKGAGE